MAKKPSFFAGLIKKTGAFFSWILSKLSKLFDRIVYSQKASLIVSLLAAIVLCISINYSDLNYRFFNKDDEVLNLTSVAVNAIYDSSEYVVEGLPDAVAVTLTGSPGDMALYKTQYSVEVTADLRNLSAGDNMVELKASNIPTGITAVVNPENVEVTIYHKTTRTYSVTPELIIGTGQSLDEFKCTSLSSTSVTIKATKAQLDSIRTVKALIDTSGKTEDFTTTATLVAYDSTGTPVAVTITPESVEATVEYIDSDAEEDSSKEDAKTDSSTENASDASKDEEES